MTDESVQSRCERCGQEIATFMLTVNEEAGMLLCPLCTLEQKSCGCSDEEE